MTSMTNEINKIDISDLENLEQGEELEVSNDILTYGFTKAEILDAEYLFFGSFGGSSVISAMTEELNTYGYEKFIERINNEFDINLEVIFDIDVDENKSVSWNQISSDMKELSLV